MQCTPTERNVTRVDGLSLRFADAYKQSLRQNGNKAKTIYNKLVVLRSLTIFAKRRKMCDQDPLEGYGLKKPKPTTQPCWTPEQADQILEATPSAYRPYFTFLRESGCRAGEGKVLTWEDVRFDKAGKGAILIRPKHGPWGSWRPKSGDQRSVPMTPNLRKLLESVPKSGPWVFCAIPSKQYPSKDRQVSERRALSALKRVLRKLALPGKLHTFRHTYISQALTRGVPEAVVRQWVGHVDPEILRLYTHVADEVSQAYVARFCGPSGVEGLKHSALEPKAANRLQHSFQHRKGLSHERLNTNSRCNKHYSGSLVGKRRGGDTPQGPQQILQRQQLTSQAHCCA